MGRDPTIRVPRGLAAAAVALLALSLSGCALGLSEFSRTASNTANALPVKQAVLEDSAVPLKPAALVEEEPAKPLPDAPAAVAVETVAPPTDYPNLNQAPAQPKSKVLSPEEKQKVIAELEALAKSQGEVLARERAKARAQCDGLSADMLRKRMLQGQC